MMSVAIMVCIVRNVGVRRSYHKKCFIQSHDQGKPLTGANNYTVHFDRGRTPPVKAFWSITMYNNKSYFVNNPINRYSIGKYTEGLK